MSVLAAIATAALVAASLAVGGGAASAAPQPFVGGGQTTFTPGRYIVTLVDASAATYDGGVNGFAPTAPDAGDQLNARRAPVTTYSDYLENKQQEVADAAGVEIDYSYTLALNGFSAHLSTKQAAALSADKNVASIAPDEIKHVTATSSTDFLGLSGPGGVWETVGGISEAGAGVVVGVLDTGIAPENPSFSGTALAASGNPSVSGSTISYVKADGGTFTGTCDPGLAGQQFSASDCSSKVIGARYFVDGFGTSGLGTPTTGEYISPRDGDGHGSHTASTAAGNADVAATVSGIDFGSITGVAPAAKIAAYKVCWSGPDPATTDDDGCATSDLIAGIDQAVQDGVDVINYSIGGGAAQTTLSPTDEAFLGAAAAGIFVSASAGNDGPDASTLDNASPWITTVAAASIPSYEATATFSDGQAFAGASITVDTTPGAEPVSGPVVTAASVAVAGAVNPNLCLPGTLDAALAAGKIIVCERGQNARVEKSEVVAAAGGIGAIIVNVVPGSIDIDEHAVPTVHLDARYHDQVMAAAAVAGATVTLTPGNSTAYTPPTPQVAGFSSRGPVLADGSDILKPDIAAPGVSILAATANAEGADPTYAFLSGTSMAAPHIAGLAALYLGVNPTATPAEVKSAMQTTAYDTVDGDGGTVTDPFVQGAGHADPTSFFEPGLVYLNDVPDWLAYIQGIGFDAGVTPIDPSNLNLASIAIGSLTASETITRTVTSTQAGTFTPSIAGLAGIDAVVSPASLTFGAAGEQQSFTVTFTRTDAPLDTFTTGSLTWTSGATAVRIPLAIQPVTIVAPDEVSGEGVAGSVSVEVTPGGTGDIPLATTGLSAGTLQEDPTGTETDHSGSGVAGDEFEYEIEVAEGTVLARFDLDSVDDTADLDLVVYLLDADGNPVAGWQSASGAADERVDIYEPEAGTYLAIASVFAANPSTAFDVVTTSVMPDGAPLALAPSVLSGVQGVPVTYSASWSGLAAYTRYLGIVSYGETGASTLVSVVTGAAAPVATVAPSISGKPIVGKTLTAHKGTWDTKGLTYAYQWQADGVDIPYATSKTLKLRSSYAGKAITVVVTATKTGIPTGTAVSEPVTVKFASEVELELSKKSWPTNRAGSIEIEVESDARVSPTGEVTIRVNHKNYTIPLSAASHGRVVFRFPTLQPGTYTVKVTYSGDAVTFGSSDDARFTVTRR